MFLSQRPNNDPQQWEHRVTGQRYADPYEAGAEAGAEAGLCDDNPRPEFTQTRDPKPWDLFGVRFAIRPITPGAVWIPRHEEFDTPVNPILAVFRQMSGSEEAHLRARRAGAFLASVKSMAISMGASHQVEDHARRVLSKLVAVYS